MQKEKKPILREMIPALLLQRFFKELDEGVAHLALEQQVELTEYMIGVAELIIKLEKTRDEQYITEYNNKETALFKKFGTALKPFIQKGLNKYFDFDLVLSEKGIYSSKEFNNLSGKEQSMSEEEINLFLGRCIIGLNLKRNYLNLQRKPEFEILKKSSIAESTADKEGADKEATRSRQMLAMYFLLKAGFDIEHRSSSAVSEVVRLVHLMTGTSFRNLQNSEIYKKFRLVPNHKKGLPLIRDLKFIRTYFADLSITKATELIDKEIELAKKELSIEDKKKLLKEK